MRKVKLTEEVECVRSRVWSRTRWVFRSRKGQSHHGLYACAYTALYFVVRGLVFIHHTMKEEKGERVLLHETRQELHTQTKGRIKGVRNVYVRVSWG